MKSSTSKPGLTDFHWTTNIRFLQLLENTRSLKLSTRKIDLRNNFISCFALADKQNNLIE